MPTACLYTTRSLSLHLYVIVLLYIVFYYVQCAPLLLLSIDSRVHIEPDLTSSLCHDYTSISLQRIQTDRPSLVLARFT